jgi:capsular polysaccharide biosynthesis protein/Mrp family chromosome partitioning ATPase
MSAVLGPDSFEAAEYVGMLRRRWGLVLALACFGLIGAFGYVLVAPKTYTATSAVNVTPTGVSQGQVANSRNTSADVNLDTEAQILTSTSVAKLAGHLLHSSLPPWQLSRQVTVTVPPNSSILDISCSEPTPAGAAACANDFAKAYLENRSANAAATISAELSSVQTKVNALQRTATALSAKIAGLPASSPTRIADQDQLRLVLEQIHSLVLQIGTLNSESANTSGGYIITTATPPSKPSSPKKSIVLPSGLVAGLLLGLIGAYLWDRRDRRIHGAADVERLLDIPVLMNLPASAFGRQVSLASPKSRTGQAFTELALSVTATLGEGNHVLLVAGTSSGVGGSLVAANLAAALARTQPDVVLVCADLTGTLAPELLGIPRDEGLAEVVAGSASVRDVARGPSAAPGLWVITPGLDPSRTLYHLRHDTVHALISQLHRHARYVVIELPEPEDGSDALVFAEFSDAALITVEPGRATRDEAAEVSRRLRRLRTTVLGAALVSVPRGRVTVRPPRQEDVGPGPAHEEFAPELAMDGREDMPGLANASTSRQGPDGASRSRRGEQAHPATRVPRR